MKIKRLAVLGVASATALAWHAPAMADDSIVDRLEAMEQRIQYLEQRVASQDEVIVEKEREIAALTGQEEAAPAGQEAAAADAWYDRVTIGGAIELEAVSNSPYEGDSTTEGSLGKAELAVGIAVNEWVSGEIVVKDDDGSIALDAATVTFAPADSPFSVTAGSQGLPFGVYDTNLVSDPLTKEIGDTGETSVVLGFEADQFNGSFFVFDGDNEPDGDSRIEGHGAAVGFALEQDDFALGLNASYINDIGDSDNLQDAISGRLAEISEALGEDEDPTYSDHVGGMSASVSLSAGGVMVLGEYVSALDPFGTHMDEVPVLDGQGSPVLDDQGNPTTTTVGLHEVGVHGSGGRALGLGDRGRLRIHPGRQGRDRRHQLPGIGGGIRPGAAEEEHACRALRGRHRERRARLRMEARRRLRHGRGRHRQERRHGDDRALGRVLKP